MLKIKNDNILIPVKIWEELKRDLYFSELIEAIEDRQELIESQNESSDFSDFRDYDEKRMSKLNNA